MASIPTPPPNTPVHRNPATVGPNLVRFTTDPTPEDHTDDSAIYWLYDDKEKAFRPITDLNAFDKYMQTLAPTWVPGDAVKAIAAGHVAVLSPDDVKNPAGGWGGGTWLSVDYSPSAKDGSLKAYDGAHANDVGTYGQARDDARNGQAAGRLDLLLKGLVNDGKLSQATLDMLSADHALAARYVSAVAYGGYTNAEIYQDLKARELAKTDPKYASVRAVDPDSPADAYSKTDAYRAAADDKALAAPLGTFADGQYFMNTPINRMSDAYYSDHVATVDFTDPKNRELADHIQASWFDLALASSEATTQQEKAVADSNYAQFTSDLKSKYNISLSSDVRQAWKQMESAMNGPNGFGARGLGVSGIAREAQDRYIQDIRSSENSLRQQNLSTQETEARKFLLGSASAGQIAEAVARMDAEDAKNNVAPGSYRSALWGLKPTADTLAFYDPKNLKAKFPAMSDADIQRLHDSKIDENGHYRSGIYQKAMGEFSTLDADGNVVIKGSGTLGLREGQAEYQQQQIINQKKAAEEKIQTPFADPQFSSYKGVDGPAPSPAVAAATGDVPTSPAAPVFPNTNAPNPQGLTAQQMVEQAYKNSNEKYVAPKVKKITI